MPAASPGLKHLLFTRPAGYPRSEDRAVNCPPAELETFHCAPSERKRRVPASARGARERRRLRRPGFIEIHFDMGRPVATHDPSTTKSKVRSLAETKVSGGARSPPYPRHLRRFVRGA
ncbi:hypothetical protein SKAU_G00403100 [Synaphobranchus kaupii]|uniref:Uncharacterized protein n=1 Tax=Synaphobranchus kaupii TaxID=118154 RepID=A0A9Q1E9H2_SYNKA|nr:hypothetical protein SKAU_G00403100 [Synaphobranchus kaupii]